MIWSPPFEHLCENFFSLGFIGNRDDFAKKSLFTFGC